MGLSGEAVHCTACAVKKLKRQPFRKHAEDVPDNHIDRIHGDAFGPLTVDILDGKKYGFMFVGGKADANGRRRRWLKLTENNTADTGYYAIQELIQSLDRKYGRHMKSIRTDNGGEFTSTLIDQLLVEKNVERELTAADSPQENGIAEQGITQNYIQAMCMMAHAGLMKSNPDLFGEALVHAVHINNAMLVGEDTQGWIGNIPIFGSVTWVNVPKEYRTKMDYRARLGLWMGVAPNHGRKSK